MSRLFITQREIDFINDIGKEVIKDVIGQKIYLFQISEIKSKVHDVYEESQDKVFETPIELDCLVKYNAQEITTNRFGSEEYYTIEAYIQSKDLLDKGIEILEGDFFSYGSVFFEIITLLQKFLDQHQLLIQTMMQSRIPLCNSVDLKTTN